MELYLSLDGTAAIYLGDRTSRSLPKDLEDLAEFCSLQKTCFLSAQPRPLEREDSHLDSHFDLSKWGAILKQHGGAASSNLTDLPVALKLANPKLSNPSSGPQSYAEVGHGRMLDDDFASITMMDQNAPVS